MSGKRGRPATGQRYTDEVLFPRELREAVKELQESTGLSYQDFVRAAFAEGMKSIGKFSEAIASFGMDRSALLAVKPKTVHRTATTKDLDDLMLEVRFLIQEANPQQGDSLGNDYGLCFPSDVIEAGDMLTAGGTGGEWVEAWPEIIGRPVHEFTQGKTSRYVARLKPPYSETNLPPNPPGLGMNFFYMGPDELITEDDRITVNGWDAPRFAWGRAVNGTVGYKKTVREFQAQYPGAYAARSFESLPQDGTAKQEASGGVL